MVGCELHLDSVFVQGPFWDVHHAGIIHQDINSRNMVPGKNLGSGLTDGFLVREIELESTVVHFWKF